MASAGQSQPLSGPAIPPSAEQDWRSSQAALLRSRLVVGTELAAILVPLGVVLEVASPPTRLGPVLAVRFGYTFVALLMYWCVTRSQVGARCARPLSFAFAALLGLGLELMLFFGASPSYNAGFMVTLVAVGLLFPWAPAEAAGMAAFFLLVYLVPALSGLVAGDRPELLRNVYFLATGGVISVIAAMFSQQVHRREFFAKRSLEERSRALDQANRSLDRSLSSMRELDKTKSALFARINHELRTPLTLILAPLSELCAGRFALAPEVRRRLELVRRNAQRLDELVAQLLELARMDQGLTEVRRGPVDLPALVVGVVREFEPMAYSRRVRLQLELPPLAPLSGDAEGLATIARNLLSNALKFTLGEGRVTISLSEIDAGCVLEVRDEGIGIEERDRERIFELFARADDARVNGIPGSGVGLAVVRELVRQHGGRVEVESAPGKGSAFRVVLPRGEAGQGTARAGGEGEL